MKKNKEYKNFYDILSIDKENDILIVDPFVINLSDVQSAGIKNIVRVRRPYWGRGNLSEFINKVEPIEFKKLLKELIDIEGEDKNVIL